MKPAEKKAILERLRSHNLLYKELSLSGKVIIIHEATGHTARKIGETGISIEQDATLEDNTRNALLTLYVPLAACSVGDLPASYDDFFWMKNEDIETWAREARAMNPQLFGLLDYQEKRLDRFLSEQEKEKKSKKPSK